MKFKVDSDRQFRSLPSLLWRLGPKNRTFATTRSLWSLEDNLHFHSRGVLGIYYCRGTKAGARKARLHYLRRCGGLLPPGRQGPKRQFDGVILFRPQSIKDIPRDFFDAASPRASRPQPKLEEP